MLRVSTFLLFWCCCFAEQSSVGIHASFLRVSSCFPQAALVCSAPISKMCGKVASRIVFTMNLPLSVSNRDRGFQLITASLQYYSNTCRDNESRQARHGWRSNTMLQALMISSTRARYPQMSHVNIQDEDVSSLSDDVSIKANTFSSQHAGGWVTCTSIATSWSTSAPVGHRQAQGNSKWNNAF